MFKVGDIIIFPRKIINREGDKAKGIVAEKVNDPYYRIEDISTGDDYIRHQDSLKMDTQYYREKRLKEILDK